MSTLLATAPLPDRPVTPFPFMWRFPGSHFTAQTFHPQPSHHQRQRSLSAPNPVAPDLQSWSTHANPAMVNPQALQSPPIRETTWTFPATGLETPAHASGGFQSFAMLQDGAEGESSRLVKTPSFESSGGAGCKTRFGNGWETDEGDEVQGSYPY